ncbi:MAG: fatty acid desaturase [Pseudomonadota bacterium]
MPEAVLDKKINEKVEARALSPKLAWPTIAFMLGVWATHFALIWFAVTGGGAYWPYTIALGFLSYLHYTYIHEAIHGNILPKGRRNRFIQDCLGWVGSIAMIANWPMLSRTHKAHHSHTNTEHDPDIFLKLPFSLLLVRVFFTCVFLMFPMALLKLIIRDRSMARGYINADTIMTKKEKIGHYAGNFLMLGVFWTAVFMGYAREAFLLWYIPGVLGFATLAILISWLPHYPFDRSDRYGVARNMGRSWLNPLFMWQNWHLIHHMWPSVPFYNYERLQKRLEPVLNEKQARDKDGVMPRHGKVQRKVPAAKGPPSPQPAE